MNDLAKLFTEVKDGRTVVLEKDRIYHIRQDDSLVLKGFFCSNSAKFDENPEGTRYTAVYLNNKKNVVIDGNGATVLVHGKMTPMLFYRCENITVKNLTVDYAVPTMTEFTVIDNNDGILTIKINPDCLYLIEGNTLFWCSEKGSDGEYFWKNAGNAPKRYIKVLDPVSETTRDFRREDLSFSHIEELEKNVLRCTLINKDAPLFKGDIVQTRNIIRDQVGSMFERCKNLLFENMRVKFMHGLGMVSQYCENITFRNCDLTPKKGRTIASTADFFQFSGCKGRIIIDSCKARGAQDDYVNVHGTHLRIVGRDDEKNSITVRFMHPETWGFQTYDEGDRIEFIKWDTLKPFAQATVKSFEKLNETDIRLFLDAPLPSFEAGKDVIENATYTPDVHIKNCTFGPTSGRGILTTTRGKVIIENNSFTKLWGPALLIEDDCNFWFESGYTDEIIFRDNDVCACNFGGVYEGGPVIQYSPKVMNEASRETVHGRLLVYANSFSGSFSGKHTVNLSYLNEAEICDNSFDAPLEINIKNCGDVKNERNILV